MKLNKQNKKLFAAYKEEYKKEIHFKNEVCKVKEKIELPEDDMLLTRALNAAIDEQKATNAYNRRVEKETVWYQQHGL